MKQINIQFQHGSALLFSFILMLALTFIAIASVNTGIMQTKMATSVEEEVNAFQTSGAALDFVLSDESYLPPTMNLVTTIFDCTDGVCVTDPAVAALPTNDVFKTIQGESIVATLERTEECSPPPRLANASSALEFNSFGFEGTSDIDKTQTNRGRSYQIEGYLTLGPKCPAGAGLDLTNLVL